MVRKRTSNKVFAAGEQSPLSRTPIYHQIFMLLRSKIHEGEYLEGQYMPGERELCEIYRISRITAVRVLNELAACGLVVREQGRGTRVRFVAQGMLVRGPMPTGAATSRPNVRARSVDDFLAMLRHRPSTEAIVYGFEISDAKGPVVQSLNLRERAKVQIATRVWRFEGKPYNHLTSHVPADIAKGWTEESLAQKPLNLLLEENGVHVDQIEERVSATLADMVLAERLEVSFGAPLLRVTRVAHDDRGRPVNYMICYYPPERYEYAVSLSRRAGGRRGPRTKIASGPAGSL